MSLSMEGRGGKKNVENKGEKEGKMEGFWCVRKATLVRKIRKKNSKNFQTSNRPHIVPNYIPAHALTLTHARTPSASYGRLCFFSSLPFARVKVQSAVRLKEPFCP